VDDPLPGGFVTAVVRAGDTVRREPAPNSESVHAVLGWFEQRGWAGAPRFLGTDELGREVICHNDLAPKNTVYRDSGSGLAPAAFIDWDLAAPGERIHDDAHVCWQYLGLGPGVADPAKASERMRLICDTYGLPGRHRAELAACLG
jgi:hypothetical protein